MSKRHASKPTVVAQPKPVVTPTEPTVEPTLELAPILTTEIIAMIRAAESAEAGFRVLQPSAKSRVKADATYVVVEDCKEPLPQARGACLRVTAACIQMKRPFKIADVVEALPTVRSAGFWVRKLAKTGHLAAS